MATSASALVETVEDLLPLEGALAPFGSILDSLLKMASFWSLAIKYNNSSYFSTSTEGV